MSDIISSTLTVLKYSLLCKLCLFLSQINLIETNILYSSTMLNHWLGFIHWISFRAIYFTHFFKPIKIDCKEIIQRTLDVYISKIYRISLEMTLITVHPCSCFHLFFLIRFLFGTLACTDYVWHLPQFSVTFVEFHFLILNFQQSSAQLQRPIRQNNWKHQRGCVGPLIKAMVWKWHAILKQIMSLCRPSLKKTGGWAPPSGHQSIIQYILE